MIEHTLRGPSECPACHGDGERLAVATREMRGRQRFISDGRGAVEFIGYDCNECGAQLRFKDTTQ